MNYIEEDIRQAGYLFLTEKINNYFDAGLKVPLSVYLLVAFDQIYLNFLREKKEEVEVATTESLEVVESDPEDPDTSDWSHIYEEDKKEK